MKKQTDDNAGAHEAAHETAIDRLGGIVGDSEFDPATLAGDVRDTILDLYKARPKPWSQLSQAEQQDVIRTIEYAARELVQKTVDTIRSAGQVDPIHAILESYAEKDGIKAALKIKTMGEDDALAAVASLHKARGKMVLVTIASAEDYLGDRGDAETDADQPDLAFEAGSDEAQPEA